MGSEPYWYYTNYNEDIDAGLQNLREQEFRAGRYHPALDHLSFPLTPNSPAPGAQHASIDDACMAGAETDAGTRSILDLYQISDSPEFCSAARLPDDILSKVFGTTKPTREMAEKIWSEYMENVERGHGIYFIYYKNNKPEGIYFAGYSVD